MRGGAALVCFASGAVLVLEILAVRLLAPYVGSTLETYTTIIGTVLAGIAAGAALGGRLADTMDPRRLLSVLLGVGGLLAIATVPLVRVVGEAVASGSGEVGALAIALIAVLPPAAVLSAVTPAVAKLALTSLEETGAVIGRLSGWATAGGLAGTFLTGFVFVPLLPTRATIYALGAALVVLGIVLGARPQLLLGAALVAAFGFVIGSKCDVESAYYCANVVADERNPSGRTLVLDDLRHSYVDLDDPRRLEFDYVRWMGELIGPRTRDGLFIGGGGFTLPRYLNAVSPGARATVLEVDGELVDLARERLGLRTGPRLQVRVGDARRTLRDVGSSSQDVVVGDAFGGLSVPWHLATREFVDDIARVLRRDGLFLQNIIDYGDLRFARAFTATALTALPEAVVLDDDAPGGNLVLVASRAALPPITTEGHTVTPAREFAGTAGVLTDDKAPADQLLQPRG